MAITGPSIRADTIIVDGFSAISAGRGGANIAFADNGAMLLENPAAMVNMDAFTFVDGSAAILVADFNYKDPQNDANGRIHFPDNPGAVGEIAFIQKSQDGNSAFGIGIFVPAGYGSHFRLNPPPLPLPGWPTAKETYEGFDMIVKVLIGGAIRVNDRLSVGANAGFAFNHTILDAPYIFQTGPFAGAPTLTDFSSTGFAPAWAVSMHYKLSEKTMIGLSYTGEIRLNMEGDVNSTVFTAMGPLPTTSFDGQLDLRYPQSVGFGLKHEIDKKRRLGIDVIWYNWKNSSKSLDFKFTNPSNPGLFPAVVRDSLPLNWDDSISIKVGFECEKDDGTILRCGYAFHDNAIPGSTITPLIPANLEHTVTFGITKTCGEKSHIDFAYMYSWGPEQPTNTSAILGGDYSFATVRSVYHVFYLGYGYSE